MPISRSARRAGEYLAAQYAARQPLDVMAQPFAPRDEAEAYAVQSAFLRRLAETDGGGIGGFKIAYTNAIMRERSGISALCSGLMLRSKMRDSPAELSAADYVRPGIECEVAVGVGADLPASGAPYTLDSVSDAIAWLAASFELVDGRAAANGEAAADPALKAIATNISNAGAILGPRVTDWRGVDLAASHGAMRVNGEVVGEGYGRDVMGHPLQPLAWLANSLATRGESLKAGQIVLTGSFAPPFTLKAGDAASVYIEGLGEATLTLGA